nr:MAG TPA: hypothetical protein [Caudoviricetes sp.]
MDAHTCGHLNGVHKSACGQICGHRKILILQDFSTSPQVTTSII